MQLTNDQFWNHVLFLVIDCEQTAVIMWLLALASAHSHTEFQSMHMSIWDDWHNLFYYYDFVFSSDCFNRGLSECCICVVHSQIVPAEMRWSKREVIQLVIMCVIRRQISTKLACNANHPSIHPSVRPSVQPSIHPSAAQLAHTCVDGRDSILFAARFSLFCYFPIFSVLPHHHISRSDFIKCQATCPCMCLWIHFVYLRACVCVQTSATVLIYASFIFTSFWSSGGWMLNTSFAFRSWHCLL